MAEAGVRPAPVRSEMSSLDTVAVVKPADVDLFVDGEPTVIRTRLPQPLYAPDPDEGEKGVYDEVEIIRYLYGTGQCQVRSTFGTTFNVDKEDLRMGAGSSRKVTERVQVMGSSGTRITASVFVPGVDARMAEQLVKAALIAVRSDKRRIELWKMTSAPERDLRWDCYVTPPYDAPNQVELEALALDVPDGRIPFMYRQVPPGRQLRRFPSGSVLYPAEAETA